MNKYSLLVTAICCSLTISLSSLASQVNQAQSQALLNSKANNAHVTQIALSVHSSQTMLVTDLHLFEPVKYQSYNLLEQKIAITPANYPIEHYQNQTTPNVIFDYALIFTDKIQSLVAAWQQFWHQTNTSNDQTSKNITNSQCQQQSS